MKVLVACEYSGRVRDAFIKEGHEAMSCDLLETEKTGPHYLGDVKDILHEEREQIVWKMGSSKDRWKIRSTTYQGIADAMAKQWSLK